MPIETARRPISDDRKNVIRVAGLLVSAVGVAVMARSLLRFVGTVRDNALEGGPALLQYPEYYRQVGAYYSRGFTTGFFLCYFLMLMAVIGGTWVDGILKARRAARAAAPAADRPANAAPVSDAS